MLYFTRMFISVKLQYCSASAVYFVVTTSMATMSEFADHIFMSYVQPETLHDMYAHMPVLSPPEKRKEKAL